MVPVAAMTWVLVCLVSLTQTDTPQNDTASSCFIMSAFYFSTPFGTYVEVPVPAVSSSNNVVCCVDVSGSMAGAPLTGVCAVLRDVWARTKTAYSVLCYNTAVVRTTVEAVAALDLQAGGGSESLGVTPPLASR